jgi:hypothetical protein
VRQRTLDYFALPKTPHLYTIEWKDKKRNKSGPWIEAVQPAAKAGVRLLPGIERKNQCACVYEIRRSSIVNYLPRPGEQRIVGCCLCVIIRHALPNEI